MPQGSAKLCNYSSVLLLTFMKESPAQQLTTAWKNVVY